MRILYLFLYLFLNVGLRIFFKRVKTVNSKKGVGRTIFVCNHPAAFMDPLVVALYGGNAVHFMARADVFKPFLKPFFWAAHMLPIYRQLDGGDTQEKNKLVFVKTSEILRNNKNILIFGEGFTDEEFIRRLKPIKKGAFRIGFSALEAMNWEHKVFVTSVGCNYSSPNMARSELLISTGTPICLNDFRIDYEENSSRTIAVLTKKLELDLINQITHVENVDYLEFHEQVMALTRKGMHPISYDPSYSLEQRHNYSKNLAIKLNEKTADQLANIESLKNELKSYFSLLDSMGISENERFLHENKTWKISVRCLKMLLMFPIALLGFVHAGILYLLVKRFVEKKFKRPVFWGSTKLLLLLTFVGLCNIPVLFLIANYFSYLGSGSAYLIGISYYLFIWFYGLIAYIWKNDATYLYRYFKSRKLNLSSVNSMASKLIDSANSI
jgi:hypothetical protein